jgi:[ribosomal protein S5]-alanine N-acetyltransferase
LLLEISKFESERLICDPLRQNQAADVFEQLQNPALYKYIPEKPPVDIENLRKRYAELEKTLSPDGNERWLNWILYWQDSAVGTIQATVRTEDKKANVAYVIFQKYQKQGFGYESCKALIRYLFNEWNVDSVIAELDTRNYPSLMLVQKLGMKHVKTTDNVDTINGCSSHEYKFMTRRDDWEKNS